MHVLKTRGVTLGALIAAVISTTVLVGALPGPSPATATAPVASSVAAPVATQEAAPAQPNVVLFLLDDMRPDEMRFLPRTRAWLASNGVNYQRAMSPHPLCCPARSGMLTGQYGQNNGVHHNQGPAGGFPSLIDPDDNVGTWAQARGYRTSYVGKFLNGYRATTLPDGGFGYPRLAGWDRWDPLVKDVYAYTRGVFYNGDEFIDRYVTSETRQRTRKALNASGDSPFFMWVNHTAPHKAQPRRGGKEDVASEGAAWDPPRYQKKYADNYRRLVPAWIRSPAFNESDLTDLPADMQTSAVSREQMLTLARARARALRSVDDSIMGTLTDLERKGKLQDTYVVFTSDNGYQFGEHRYAGKNLMFNESLRIPLYVSAPDRAAGTVSTPVTLLDLTASIAEWTGSTPTRRIDGLALDRAGERDTILIQSGNRIDPATDFWSYRGVRTDRYLFAAPPDGGLGVLFDSERDPHQLTNRYADPAYVRVREELERRTAPLVGCSGWQCNRDFPDVPEPDSGSG